MVAPRRDIDVENCFPSLAGSAVSQAMIVFFLPDFHPLAQAEAIEVVLPCGASHPVKRGTAQGEPMGPLHC